MKNIFVPLWLSVFLLGIALVWSWFTPIDISVRASGIVRPLGDPVKIVAEVAGRITQVCVREGGEVHLGDPILQLDTRDLMLKKRGLSTRIHFTELRLAELQRRLSDATSFDVLDRSAAETNIESARIRFGRADLLIESGLVSRQVRDESQIALSQAEADSSLKRSQSASHLRDVEASATPLRADLAMLYHDLEQTQLDLGRLTITSPADGQITSLTSLHSNEILSPGTAIAAVVPSAHSLIVESWLPTSDRAYIDSGQLVRLRAGDMTFDATVLSISPDARFNDSLAGAYRVLITPQSQDLHLGMTFDVHFITGRQRLLLLLFDKISKEFR